MGNFKKEEVFPVIHDYIKTICKDNNEYAKHEDIVRALINDPDGSKLVSNACAKHGSWSPEKMAATMVAWFSQNITADPDSKYAKTFERTDKQPYAYKPRVNL